MSEVSNVVSLRAYTERKLAGDYLKGCHQLIAQLESMELIPDSFLLARRDAELLDFLADLKYARKRHKSILRKFGISGKETCQQLAYYVFMQQEELRLLEIVDLTIKRIERLLKR